MTITREDLKKEYEKTLLINKDILISSYVKEIEEEVRFRNSKGYKDAFHNIVREEYCVLEEIVDKLQKIFTDSKIRFTMNERIRDVSVVYIDWS